MDFFEQELRKLFENSAMLDDIRFTGRACIGRLTDTTNAKLRFVTLGHADRYEAIEAEVLNRNEGKIDSVLFRFSDILGKKPVSNPNFSEGLIPHIWACYGKHEWYVYEPAPSDYVQIGEAIEEYLGIFQEPEQGHGMSQHSY